MSSAYIVSDLKGEYIAEKFYKKKKIRIEKLIKRKSDKPYVKRNGYDNDNSFNSWIDKKHSINE